VRERRLSKKPRRRRRNARGGRSAGRRREEKEKKKKKARTKVDETRGILVCGHSRCLQPTIMIIAPGVLSLVRPTCSPGSFICIFLFSDLCSPAPLRTAASPTFNPLRPREVRWVQADRFARRKTKSDIYPILSRSARYSAYRRYQSRKAPFRKDSNNQALCLSHEFCSVSDVLLKCVISFRYRIYEMRNLSVRYYLTFVAFVNFFHFNIPWHYEIVGTK